MRDACDSRVGDRFLVPATAEPFSSCGLAGSAEFREREPGGGWVTRHIGRRDFFVTRSKTPYEVSFRSPAGEELETVQIHVAVEPYRAALEAVHPGQADKVELVDYFGRDEAFSHLCFACTDMLSAATPGISGRVAQLTALFASFLAEKYTAAAAEKPDFRGGLPIRQLHKVEDYLGRAAGQGYFRGHPGGACGFKSLPLLPGVQANHGPVPVALRDPEADYPRPATHA